MIAILTKIFAYLQATGVLATGVAFVLAVWKAVLPLAKSRAKTNQQKALLTAIEGFVARYAQVAAMSKTDRFNAVLNDTLDFASEHGYTWAKSNLVKGLIESIYQSYKSAGKDIAPVLTTPSPDVVEDKPEDVSQSSAVTGTPATDSNNVESDGVNDIKQLEGEVDK